MPLSLLQTTEELAAYDHWVKNHPHGTLWQSLEWKAFQEALGRQVKVYAAREGDQIVASALVVIDKTAFSLSTWDIPRGPLGQKAAGSGQRAVLLDNIVHDATEQRCLSLFFSSLTSLSIINYQLSIRPSGRHEQPEATRVLDLTLPEDQILGQMKPKGRYNISVAKKHGIQVERSADIDAFHALLRQTAGRDGFGILPKRQYEIFRTTLPESFLLLAKAGTEPIAGLLGVLWNGQGIYYYGASSYEHRALMAPYLLQWEAMRHCKASGCTSYDLLGIAPPDAGPDHPWSGVSGFKEKFGGKVVTYPPERQIILRPFIQKLLSLKRRLLG